MLKLWFLIEFQKNNKRKLPRIIIFLKMFLKYLGIIGLFFTAFDNTYGMLRQEGYLPFFLSINVAFLIIFHGLIQLFFFKTLEKDVIISFLPEKAYDYIKVRIFMNSIKWGLAFILPSMFFLKRLVIISGTYFYLDLTLMVLIAIILNYFIAIYLRYILNITENSIVKRITIFFATVCVSILLIASFSINLLEILNSIGKEKSINSYIYVNNYFHLLIIVIFIMSLISLNLTNSFFKKNSSKIIINVENHNKVNSHKFERIVTYFIKNKSFINKSLITKDVKSILRGFSYGHLFFLLIQILYIVPLTYFYLNTDAPRNLEESIVIISIFSILIFINNLIIALVGGIIFNKEFKIREDDELLKLYDIKNDKVELINIKRWTAYLIINGPMYILYAIILVSKINIWSVITSVCIIISSLLLGKALTLITVKIINKSYSNKTLIQVIGIAMYMITGYVCCQLILSLANEKRNLLVYCIYNLFLLIIYFYDSRINFKSEEDKVNA